MVPDILLFPFSADRSWYERYWLAPEAQPAGCPHRLLGRLGRFGRRIARLAPTGQVEPVALPAWAAPHIDQRRALS